MVECRIYKVSNNSCVANCLIPIAPRVLGACVAPICARLGRSTGIVMIADFASGKAYFRAMYAFWRCEDVKVYKHRKVVVVVR